MENVHRKVFHVKQKYLQGCTSLITKMTLWAVYIRVITDTSEIKPSAADVQIQSTGKVQFEAEMVPNSMSTDEGL